MLINFTVQNFHSFGTEQTLNLVASESCAIHKGRTTPIANTGKEVLHAVVIYGANAAGKSNLARAIAFAINTISGFEQPLSQFAFRANESVPSSFEFRFLADEQVFVYGFDVTPDIVVQNWLLLRARTQ